MTKRILVIKPSSFGDIIHLFPALELLKRNLPGSELDFLVKPEFASLLDFSPFPVSEKIIFERRKLGTLRGFCPGLVSLRKALRRKNYDYVIDFQGLFRSGFCAGLAKGKVKAGFAHPREKLAKLFYTHKIPVPRLHAVERNCRLVERLLGLERCEVIHPELPSSFPDKDGLTGLPEKYIVLLPGSRWQSKRFPPEVFRGIVEELKKYMPDMNFIALDDGAGGVFAEKLGKDITDLTGKTSVPVLFDLLRKSYAVIGNDSGPLHAAAALGKKVFGLYGPSVPELTGPYGENCMTITAGAECSGCLKRNCPEKDILCHKLDTAAVAEMIAGKLGGDK